MERSTQEPRPTRRIADGVAGVGSVSRRRRSAGRGGSGTVTARPTWSAAAARRRRSSNRGADAPADRPEPNCCSRPKLRSIRAYTGPPTLRGRRSRAVECASLATSGGAARHSHIGCHVRASLRALLRWSVVTSRGSGRRPCGGGVGWRTLTGPGGCGRCPGRRADAGETVPCGVACGDLAPVGRRPVPARSFGAGLRVAPTRRAVRPGASTGRTCHVCHAASSR